MGENVRSIHAHLSLWVD